MDDCEHIFIKVNHECVCKLCGIVIVDQIEELKYAKHVSFENDAIRPENYISRLMYITEMKLRKSLSGKDLEYISGAIDIYNKFIVYKKEHNLNQLKLNNNVLLATCFYYSAKDSKCPYTSKQIHKLFGVTEKCLMKGIKIFCKLVNTGNSPFNNYELEQTILSPISFDNVINKICNELMLSETQYKIVYSIAMYLYNKGTNTKNTYEAIVFICIVYICNILNSTEIYSRLLSLDGVCNPGIIKGYKSICFLNEEIYNYLISSVGLETIIEFLGL